MTDEKWYINAPDDWEEGDEEFDEDGEEWEDEDDSEAP